VPAGEERDHDQAERLLAPDDRAADRLPQVVPQVAGERPAFGGGRRRWRVDVRGRLLDRWAFIMQPEPSRRLGTRPGSPIVAIARRRLV
jgi:hypothetical protein